MDTKTNIKTIRRRRSECSWKRTSSPELEMIDYPPGPIEINASWNPVNRAEKPPYSYATIIGHAILTSKERKLTLHDIYVWITENYPFYSNDTQGWQNSIRHNLSLHKSFVKIDRDPNSQNPPRKGCFWTIRPGKEKYFIDNLQRNLNPVRKQQSLSQLVSARQRQQISRRSSAVYDPNKSIGKGPLRTISTALPDTEPIVVSSSSDHLSSPSSSSLSGSPTYNQLLYNVPETSMSYNVYPEHATELFGETMDFSSGRSTTYMTDSSSTSHPPSLSPCDAYSTTSSYADNHFLYSTSADYHSQRVYPTTGLQHSPHYNHTIPGISNNHGSVNYAPTSFIDNHQTIMDWSNSSSVGHKMNDTFLQPPFHHPMIKQEQYHSNTDSPSTSLYLQQARNSHNHHPIGVGNNNFNLFHR